MTFSKYRTGVNVPMTSMEDQGVHECFSEYLFYDLFVEKNPMRADSLVFSEPWRREFQCPQCI